MKGITRRIGSSLIAPLVASALAGCASGGGSKEGSDAIACLLAGPFCAFMGMGAPQKAGSGNTVAPVSNGPSNWQPPTQFTNFSAVAPQSGTYASSIGIDVTSQAAYWEGTANFSYEAQSREMGSVGPSGPALPPELAQPTGPVPAYLLRTTLSANGQPAAVPNAAIRTDIHEPLDVHRDFSPERTLHAVLLLDRLTQLVHVGVREIAYPLIGVDPRLVHDLQGGRTPDPEDVGQSDLNLLVAREIDASNTSHYQP